MYRAAKSQPDRFHSYGVRLHVSTLNVRENSGFTSNLMYWWTRVCSQTVFTVI